MDSKLFKKFDAAAERAGVKRNTEQAIDWFTRYRSRSPAVAFNRVEEGLKTANRIAPGMMLTYAYNPKHKEKLPFYDIYPLIILLDVTKDGWYGANIHYLPPRTRAELFKELAYNKRSPLAIAKALEKNPLTKHCLKRYLSSYLVTRPKVVPVEEWDMAITLPFEGFKKASKKDIWSKVQ